MQLPDLTKLKRTNITLCLSTIYRNVDLMLPEFQEEYRKVAEKLEAELLRRDTYYTRRKKS